MIPFQSFFELFIWVVRMLEMKTKYLAFDICYFSIGGMHFVIPCLKFLKVMSLLT